MMLPTSDVTPQAKAFIDKMLAMTNNERDAWVKAFNDYRPDPRIQRIKTTPEHEVVHGIALSLDFLQSKLDEIAALKRQLAERDRIILAILHGTDRLRDDIEGETWPDEIYSDTLAKLKALADADAERKAMRV